MAAIAVWRLYPTQIESGLFLYAHRDIGEWHTGEMSSQTLLGILEELPETSKFKEASERTRRIVEHEGKLLEFPALLKLVDGSVRPVDLPEGAVLVSEYVDWTYDQKLLARNVRETVSLRVEVGPADGSDIDMGGLLEPRDQIVAAWHQKARDENRQGAKNAIRRGLFGE